MEQRFFQRVPLAWMIWGLSALFYFYEFFLQVSPSVMVPELMHAFDVNATALGELAAFYFYAYASIQIPVGIMLDRYGPRILLTISALVCMVGCLLFGSAESLLMAKIGRFAMGLGSAFAIIGCMKLAANWFPPQRFGLISGITVTIGMLGAIAGQTPLAWLIALVGWRASVIILAVAGGIFSYSMWQILRDSPSQKTVTKPISNSNSDGFFAGLRLVLKQRQMWLVAAYGGLMFAPTSIFGALWGVPFFTSTYHIARPTAAALISLIFVGWAVGSTCAGWFSDRIGRRLPTMYLGTSIALICMLIILYIPHLSFLSLNILLFSFGFFSSGFLPSYSIAREINPNHVNATALGFMNMMNMIGGAIGQPLVGWLLDLTWSGKLEKGIRVYTNTNFEIALTILPLSLALAFIVLLFIKETYCGMVKNHDLKTLY